MTMVGVIPTIRKGEFSETDIQRLRELLGDDLRIPARWEGVDDETAIEAIMLLGDIAREQAIEDLRVARSGFFDDVQFVD